MNIILVSIPTINQSINQSPEDRNRPAPKTAGAQNKVLVPLTLEIVKYNCDVTIQNVTTITAQDIKQQIQRSCIN
jgi:hypothetical protein